METRADACILNLPFAPLFIQLVHLRYFFAIRWKYLCMLSFLPDWTFVIHFCVDYRNKLSRDSSIFQNVVARIVALKHENDLLDSTDYNFLSYTVFITKYNIKRNYLEYYKVVSALKRLRKKCFPNQNLTTLQKAAENLFSSEKVCKEIYQIVVKRKTSSPVKSQGKWLSEDIFEKTPISYHFYALWKQS